MTPRGKFWLAWAAIDALAFLAGEMLGQPLIYYFFAGIVSGAVAWALTGY
jgi:hypothetical protein